jgi:DNA polymerase III subunit chi
VPELAFHFNVPERVAYAARLLRKAQRLGSEVAVVGDPSLLDRLDRQLWVAEPMDFVPHLRLRRGEAAAAHLQATPLWLCDTLEQVAPRFTQLVSLAAEVLPGFERFERVFEVVADEPDERASARQRWRAYQDLGCTITRHDVATAPPG